MNSANQVDTGPGPGGGVGNAPSLVLIGASTGGTRVLTELLRLLPPLRACVVIVQHMPEFINESFRRNLARVAAGEVRLARHGDLLEEGLTLLAPSNVHCRFGSNRRVQLTPGPAVNFVCPSIDVTWQSVQAPFRGRRLVGVLLTGMGRDGAAGLQHLKKLGGVTVAQNEETCAVYGMPAEAVRLGCVDYELPPESIARLLASAVA